MFAKYLKLDFEFHPFLHTEGMDSTPGEIRKLQNSKRCLLGHSNRKKIYKKSLALKSLIVELKSAKKFQHASLNSIFYKLKSGKTEAILVFFYLLSALDLKKFVSQSALMPSLIPLASTTLIRLIVLSRRSGSAKSLAKVSWENGWSPCSKI